MSKPEPSAVDRAPELDPHLALLTRLAHPGEGKIILLVLDGVGDLRTAAQPQTALDRARIPHLDALAKRGALGRIVPVATGVTPGSGPGHLALFGYDPRRSEVDIGRGVLEALGLGMQIQAGDVVARGNFATADSQGRLTDRRAGRISSEECRRVVERLRAAVPAAGLAADGVEVILEPGESHRFVLVLRGRGLGADLADTDPQELGVGPLGPRALAGSAEPTARALARLLPVLEAAIADEPKANRLLLRGFSGLPQLPQLPDLYRMRFGAFAGYPLYRGVAGACGMEVIPCGKYPEDLLAAVREHWQRFDFFFLHVKQTDMAGEDGNLDAKVAAIERADAILPELLALGPAVVAVTGDHSTPAPMAAHSWHPVPLLLWSDHCFVDETDVFTELAAARGALGTFPARELMGLLLANAGRLAKYGA
jgi:2,3-bisphosphoglycerate-independent phosphoglycerate mutase